MNTLKTIYDKLSDKTELAKHEVNLTLIDELERQIKLVEQSSNLYFQIAEEVKKATIRGLAQYKAVKNQTPVFMGIVSKLEMEAKNLGLSINQYSPKIEKAKQLAFSVLNDKTLN